MGLQMKYFILKPGSKFRGDPYARASRRAMLAFSEEIQGANPELSGDLMEWVRREVLRDKELDVPLKRKKEGRDGRDSK